MRWPSAQLMPPPLICGGIKQCFCLTSVAYIGPNSRTERPRKTKIGRGSQRHTLLGHHFQGQKVKITRPLYSPRRLRIRQLHMVTMGTYSPWEPTATLRSGAVGSAARGALAPTEGGEGRGNIVAAPAQLVSHNSSSGS